MFIPVPPGCGSGGNGQDEEGRVGGRAMGHREGWRLAWEAEVDSLEKGNLI